MFKVSSNRWKFAQNAEKEYQESKHQRYINNKASFINLAKQKSTYVTELLFSVVRYKVTENDTAVEIGSGSHGCIWFFPCQKRYAIDPMADYYFEKFTEIQNNGAHILAEQGENISVDDDSVDIFISENVLDHTEYPDKVLKEVRRCLKESGYFYCAVDIHSPFWYCLSHVYNVIFKLGIKLKMPAFPAHPHHFRKKDIIHLFEGNQFSIKWSRLIDEKSASHASLKERVKNCLGKNQVIELIATKK